MATYIQIGSGSGDEDKGSSYIDGFTKFIKNKGIKDNDRILLVEANKLNIKKLENCWKNFLNVKIYNFGIVSDSNNLKEIYLYYTEDDAPSFQVTSDNYDHVKKHYPESEIKKFSIQAKKISEFLTEETNNDKIEYLAIDIEGMDFEVLMSMNFNKFNIQHISFEFLHLKKNNRKKLLHKLADNGYSFKGPGFDINGYDFMFEKKTNLYLKFKTKYFTPSIKKFIKSNK